MRAATDPSTDHLMTFVMRCTLPLAVVGIVAAVLFIGWGSSVLRRVGDAARAREK